MSEYHVPTEATVYFSLWEFRAAIQTADLLGSMVQLAFAQGGDPLFLRFEPNECLRAEFILATTGEPHIQPVTHKRPARREAAPRAASGPAPPAPERRVEQEHPLDAHTSTVLVKDETSSSEDELLPVRSVRPKREPTVPAETAAASDTVAPTPAEASGNRDEHPSTLFQEPLDDFYTWPDSDPEELPATQSSHAPRKRVRVTHLSYDAVPAAVLVADTSTS